jgi:hypothetical protein
LATAAVSFLKSRLGRAAGGWTEGAASALVQRLDAQAQDDQDDQDDQNRCTFHP